MTKPRIVAVGSGVLYRMLSDLLSHDPRLLHARAVDHVRGLEVESVLALGELDAYQIEVLEAARERQAITRAIASRPRA